MSLSAEGAVNKKGSAKSSPSAEQLLQEGRDAFLNYDFEKAHDLYSKYEAAIQKSKKKIDDNFELWENELITATNAFDRVEKIVVVDSLSMPKISFFREYALSPSSGTFAVGAELESNPGVGDDTFCFISEDGGRILWSQADEEGIGHLKEGIKLLDGSWEVLELNPFDDEEETRDLNYPYLMGDGITLYFSATGEGSMGGQDLFVAQRDALTGEFLQPLNLGMPYNSPSDDLLMAIDEENGIGWWATSRHDDEDSVTVYVYLTNDVRANYASDSDNLIEMARLDNFKATQEEGDEAAVQRAKATIRQLRRSK